MIFNIKEFNILLVLLNRNIGIRSRSNLIMNISQAEFTGERMSVPQSKTCRKELKYEILFFKNELVYDSKRGNSDFDFFFNNKMLYYRWYFQYVVLSTHFTVAQCTYI